jgi:phage repressor protein C with HTH and peptisase S24 domain
MVLRHAEAGLQQFKDDGVVVGNDDAALHKKLPNKPGGELAPTPLKVS